MLPNSKVKNELISPSLDASNSKSSLAVFSITDKLADLQKKMKDLDEDKPKGPSNVTNNALFVGSTSELSKMIKEGILNNKDD